MGSGNDIQLRALTPSDWPVLLALMGPRGVGGGCWCQWAVVPRGGKLWRECQGEANRRAFQGQIESGDARGSLAFAGEECVGWCRYGPTESFPRLANSPSLSTDPPAGTWSVVCFHVPSRWRGRGVAAELLDHALDEMRKEGVELVEAYPIPDRTRSGEPQPAGFAWTGLKSMFVNRGFKRLRRTGVAREVYRLPMR